MEDPMLTWRKLTSAKLEEAWTERLEFIAERVAMVGLPGGKSLRIEAYALSKKEGAALVEQFGGQLRSLNERIYTHQKKSTRGPIRVREKLLVADSETQRAGLKRKFPGRDVLVVPAANAFGTGEHATTASCLRLLSDLADECAHGKWDMLDLGTGSGILALAAKLLGARRVDAFDFDPIAVRVAGENGELNGIAGVHFKKVDVLSWKPPRTWDIVAANLYSEVLVAAAPAIARATKPGGRLIFSGVMRHQEKECVAAMKKAGFGILETVRKGKWVTTLAVKD